jgi:uncharacterized protein YndB with AHSA1/START domain
MTERSVTHASFCIERVYDAAPARVFAAFADPKAKARWFSGPPNWVKVDEAHDFRIGGRDRQASRMPDGAVTAFHNLYHDIVPGERIAFSYDMRLNDVRISLSLTTVELRPHGERHASGVHRAGRLPRWLRQCRGARGGHAHPARRPGREPYRLSFLGPLTNGLPRS